MPTIKSVVLVDGQALTLTPSTGGTGEAILNTSAPSISGIPETGRTLVASTGEWSVAGLSFAYQWRRSGSPIAGATASSYEVVVADEGRLITVTVTATRSGYSPGSATSGSVLAEPPTVVLPEPTATLWFRMPDYTFPRYWAHYFPPYPPSLVVNGSGGNTAGSNYYNSGYLAVNGESGAHAAYGGLLRDMPIRDGAPWPTSPTWQYNSIREDIVNARRFGIHGFMCDILGSSGNNWEVANWMFDAASETIGGVRSFPGFYAIPMLDGNGGTGQGTSANAAAALNTLLSKACALRVGSDYVVATYRPENFGALGSASAAAGWWDDVINRLRNTYGKNVRTWHCFGNPSNATAFRNSANPQEVTGRWGLGGADPGIISSTSAASYITQAHTAGERAMLTIFRGWQRPKHREFDESKGTQALRAAWARMRALAGPNDVAQVSSWNDYSETHHIGVSRATGGAYAAVSAWEAAKWLRGSAPQIVRDAVVVSARARTASPTITGGQTQFMAQRSGTGRSTVTHEVEVGTYLTMSDVVRVQIGSNVHTYTAPAGEYYVRFPIAAGAIKVTTDRGVELTAPWTVRSSSGNDDWQYFAAYAVGSTQYTAGQSNPTPA